MSNTETYLITGGAGFIGSHFVDYVLMRGHRAIVLDKLTYSGNLNNLKNALSKKAKFIKGDIQDSKLVLKILKKYKINKIVNFAAESHVDNSIENSAVFMQTNILGTHSLLQASNSYYQTLSKSQKNKFRFCQISTDECFGALGLTGKFTETTSYDPKSPYSASKASADHLVLAWCHTYGLPSVITHCSNNYGLRQHPEKLIPKTIKSIIENKSIVVYGNGSNVRDWIHVFDHCQGIYAAINKGRVGERYLFGGSNELSNLELINKICTLADKLLHRHSSTKDLITFVKDRKGHDFRYAVDYSKARKELGFIPSSTTKLDTELLLLLQSYIEKESKVCQ